MRQSVDFALPLTQYVEHVFSPVTDLHQIVDTEKSRSTLDSVEAAKHGIEQFRIIWTLFEIHQLLIKLLQDFTRLQEKVLKDIVILIEAHDTYP